MSAPERWGHKQPCPCPECIAVDTWPHWEAPDWSRLIHPGLAAIARRRPEIDWLCWLPRPEREWYAADVWRVAWLVDLFPYVTEEEWGRVLPVKAGHE